MKKYFTIVLVAGFVFLSMLMNGQENKQLDKAYANLKEIGEVYFSFEVIERDKLNLLSKIISVDNVVKNGDFQVYAYANTDEFNRFLQFDIDFKVLEHPGSLVRDPKMLYSLSEKNTASWDFYPTYPAYLSMMYQFQTDYPGLCQIVSIGQSVNGREILYAKITDNVDSLEAEPRLNYTSTMHGDETVGYVLMLRMIDYLLTNYNIDPQVTALVNNTEIWINPCANPDGTYNGGNNTVNGAIRYNANGVDLNRNFPDYEDGPHPDGYAWQMETLAFMAFADSLEFVMAANFHGGAEVLNYPWDTQPLLHADDAWWQHVCREYADTAQANSPANYLTQLNNGITNGYAWYTTNGSRQDYMNYYEYCREVTLEISNTKKPAASTLPSFWNYNYKALLNYIQQASYGVNGIVTDTITGEPLLAKVFIAGHDTINTWAYSKMPHGDYYRPIKAGTYNITYSAPGYQSKTILVTVADNATTMLDVQLGPAPPVAAFYADVTSSCTGEIHFIDQTNTLPGSNYLWSFGDGTSSTNINPVHYYSQDGIFDVSLTVTNAVGANTATQNGYIMIDMPDSPLAFGDTVCGPQSATLTASGNGIQQWFADSVGGTVLATGSSFTTPILSASTSYYVSDSVEALPVSAAKYDTTGGGGYFNSASVHYLVFDCFAPVTLKTVKVYANTAGSRAIILRNSAGSVLDAVVINIPQGEQVVELNFELPVANDLRLEGPLSPDLYRNNAGLTYPYTLPGILSVKYSSAGTNPFGYYYYFYDWQVQGESCISPRALVTAEVSMGLPVPGFSYTQNSNTIEFTNESINASSYLWDFGDGSTSTEMNPVHQYQTLGTFSVSLMANNACGSDSFDVDIDILITVAENVDMENQVQIYPNPASNSFCLDAGALSDENMELVIFDILGHQIKSYELPSGNKRKNEFDVSGFPNGLYMVKLRTSDNSTVRRLLINR
ncbi:MAG: PKD domain-containing protein [Bacteroidales bacterium]|nr:PKD domain-containing protein [Bacteroidales bacterium]MCF8455630.1 PKD domain-containing protein [Bacteroidales bacterium]